MEEKRVAEYFVVAGLPAENRKPLDGFSDDTVLKPTYKQDPIVDITVINKGQGETPPSRFRCIETTPTGHPADLNHGSIRFPEMYLCYRRGRDKPPITDIGVLYDGKEKISPGCDAIYQTPYGRSANVNNSNSNHTFITYRRAMEKASCDTLSVMDICIIIATKGETPPHAFMAVEKTLNKSMMGSTVYICYKKSMAKNDFIAYKPGILGRYPLDDHSDFPLAHNVPMFCLPLGATIEVWPAQAQHPMPTFSTFVLTQETGGKVYGAAVTFYEDFDSNTLTPQQQIQLGLITSPTRKEKPANKTLHQTKCVCLLSRWPFFNTFKTFLHYLYRISISGDHPVPLERYITHFMTEVPFPTPQRPRIQVELNFNTISLFLPEESPLPQSGASYTTLLKHLGPENCMNVLLYTLMEHKILIHSLCPEVLTSAAEAIAHMIFPFHWKCPYIPLCPLGLSEYLCAPTPFIVGVDSRYFDLFDPPPDVTCVDLDTSTVSVAEDKRGSCSSYKIMPKKLVKQLRTTLERLHELCCRESFEGAHTIESKFETYPVDQDLLRRKKRLEMDTAIQEAFLRFMVSLLRGYKNHLLPITQQPNQMTTDFTARFDAQGFIKSRDKAYQKFYQMLKDTQNFTSFIQERSFVSDKDASLEFFDECAEKMEEGREDVRLIELEDSCNSERTAVITPPEPEPDGKIFHYSRFPKLNPALFPEKPKPAQISVTKNSTPCPNSPMTKRTKQEIRFSQKAARKFATVPDQWAKCLLWHCYSLWFIHLPSYVKAHHSKAKALRNAYDVLCCVQAAKLHMADEVCYRVLMQLCGQYHQPVLAVKVFSEMRQLGVDPNAITYGFYNKAVLESKWPSADTAYLRWNKVRNAILVISQFRQVLKARRRQSACSGTESDLDRISRASIDSYLDEPSADKPDAPKAAVEFVSNLVNVEGHSEEKTSTGGMSDRGYSSMTLEDAKRISIVIGSQDSLDSVGKQRADPTKLPNGRVTSAGVQNVQPKVKVNNKEPPSDTDPLSMAAALTVVTSEDEKPSHIVRRSIEGSSGSAACRDELTQPLMMTNDTLDDTVFRDPGSVSPAATSGESDETSEKTKKASSASISDGDRLGSAPVMAMSKESSNDSGIAQSDCGSVSDSRSSRSSKSETRTSNSVNTGQSASTDTNNDPGLPLATQGSDVERMSSDLLGSVAEDLPSPIIGDHTERDLSGDTPPIPQTFDASPLQPDCLQKTPKLEDSNHGNSTLQSEDLLGSADVTPVAGHMIHPPTDDKSAADDSALLEDSFVSPDFGLRSEEPSPTRSVHSMRTPVTENDPLGLFITPTLSAVASAPVIATEPHRSNSLEGAESIGSLEHPQHKGPSRNMLIDLQPFGGTSTPVRARAHGDGVSSPTRTGLSSSSASSPGSPPESWSPLSTQSQQPSMAGITNINQAGTPTRKSSTLPAMGHTSTPVHRSYDDQSATTSTPHRRGKPPSRSESFSSAFRSVTSRMANKFTEFKQSMATPTKGASGSSSSLHRPDIDRLISEEEEESHMRKAGSLDHLGQGEMSSPAPAQPTQSSLEDVMGAANTNAKASRLGMPTFFNKASHLWGLGTLMPQSVAIPKDWATKFGSMTESLKTSLKESFSMGDDFSDSDDEDYYYKSADSQSLSSSATRDDDGSLHDYNSADKVNVIHSILEPRDDTDRCSLDRVSLRGGGGSVQNIPQALFNIAVEVEMCSLSRCQTCKSLLYDEEIMAGWTPDDSNLNTTCSFCSYKFVPSLQVYVKDYRHCSKPTVVSPSQSVESMHSVQSTSSMQYKSGASMPNSNQCNGAHRSMTSLTSADNMPCDNKTANSELSNESAELPNDSTEGFNNDSSPNISVKKSHISASMTVKSSVAPLGASNISTSVPDQQSPSSDGTASPHAPESNLIQLSPPATPHKGPSAPPTAESGSEPSSNGNGDAADQSASSTTNSVHVDVSDSADDDSTGGQPEERDSPHRQCVASEPITVPYLSPLVLRKELENVLEQDGDKCLNSPDFVDEHPILYWNLLWYFKRLEVPSHIPGFILSAKSTNKIPPPRCWSAADSRHVSVRAVWDHAHMHEDLGYPLYILWKKATRHPSGNNTIVTDLGTSVFTVSMLTQILKYIREDDLLTPIQMIMQARQKQRDRGMSRFRSMYRDLLFLTLVAFSRDLLVDLDLFDREYRNSLLSLSQKESSRTHVCDSAPSHKTMMFRRIFSNLEL